MVGALNHDEGLYVVLGAFTCPNCHDDHTGLVKRQSHVNSGIRDHPHECRCKHPSQTSRHCSTSTTRRTPPLPVRLCLGHHARAK
jgi:hypothetical protein